MNVYHQLATPYLKRRAAVFNAVFLDQATAEQRREYERATRMVDRLQLRECGPGLRVMEEQAAEGKRLLRELRKFNRDLNRGAWKPQSTHKKHGRQHHE